MTQKPGVTIIHDSYIHVKPIHVKLKQLAQKREVYQADNISKCSFVAS